MRHEKSILRRPWPRFLLVILVLVTLTLAIAIPRLNTQATTTAHAANGSKPNDFVSWPPTYLGDNGRTNYNSSETTINPLTAPTLQQVWEYIQGKEAPITAQPVISNNLLYYGVWDGNERASDPSTGHRAWIRFMGLTRKSSCEPPKVGVASTATIATVTINGQSTSVDFVGGGLGQFYAVNANTGKIIWHKQLGGDTYHFIWGSPAFYNGSIYIGVSSIPQCNHIQGQLFQLDGATGKLLNTFNVVPNGCTGGPIWGSPTIDTQTGMLYFGTGAADTCAQGEPYADALVELQASNLSYVASWQAPASKGVSEFRSTPTLFTATINGNQVNMVGLPNYNGYYYAFDRTNIGAGPLWQDQLSLPFKDISTYKFNSSSSAWDGTALYIGENTTTINGQQCTASVRALNPADGSYLWEKCLSSGPVLAPVTVVPGLVSVGAGTTLMLLDATNGNTLFSFTTPRPGAIFQGPSTISNGELLVGDNHGEFFAFTPSGLARSK